MRFSILFLILFLTSCNNATFKKDSLDPYTILGISYDIDNNELKSAYRKLIREHHPDTLIAQGMPEEFIEIANNKVAAINAAYDKICTDRGIK